ncbi:DUF3048 domain-containing protein [Niallia oryzisoli]|uniref:DUF3048 domain-containing protein n=1 Tax=Niallia oryzisoli TaxID=1737571 RepID=A0ABZ2CAB1_9BACI
MRKRFALFLVIVLITSLFTNQAFAFANEVDTEQTVKEETNKSDESINHVVSDSETKDEKIVFEDYDLEMVIREQLRKISGDLLRSDVESITSLDAGYKNISSLKGLQFLTNLKSLYLGGNNISDIEPLRNLTNLEHLDLGYNNIKNIEPLSNLVNLYYLDLGGNRIEDIDSLGALLKLENLYLQKNSLTDIGSLESLINLKYLELGNNLIEDISALVKNSNNGGLGNSKVNLSNNLLKLSQGTQNVLDIQTLLDNGVNVSYIPQRELVKVSGIELYPENLTLSLNQTYSLHAEPKPYNATNRNVSWTSSNKAVATINEDGLVTAVSEGESIITVTTDDGGYKDSIKVKVFSDGVVNFPDPNLEALIRERINKATGELQKSDLAEIRDLQGYNRNISNIQGIENLVNLYSLELTNNQIEDISPLETLLNNGGLPKWINLNGNYLNIKEGSETLNIIQNIKAKGVDVYYESQKTRATGVQINSNYGKISTLGLVKDKFAEKQLSATLLPQNAYVNSKIIWTSSNDAVAKVDNNGTVKAVSEGTATITVTTEDGGHQDSIEVTVYPDEVVTIEDKNLETLIRNQVGRLAGDIKRSDVLPVETLSYPYSDISNLEGLENFVNLQDLNIGGNSIKDLSQISNLINLSQLNLSDTGLSDISSLTGLNNLSWLRLYDNNIRDIGPIATIPNLSYLDVRWNKLTDISTFAQNVNYQNTTNPLEFDLSYNYLDLSKESQNAKDIQTLLDHGFKVTYLPQNTPDPSIKPLEVYSVVIDNQEGARPQAGISDAELIYELAVAPGITRYLALFDASKDIDKIGPVRSARKSLTDIAAGYRGAFAHAGGSGESLSLIPNLPIMNIDEIYGSGEYFYRSKDRVAPHNLYTDSKRLTDAIQDRDGDTGALSTNLLPVGSITGGTDANKVVTTFKGRAYETAFNWDAEAKRYTKYENNKKVVTEEDSSIQVNNVIQIFVPHTQYYSSEWLIDVDMIGSGPAHYYRDGKVWKGYWKKTSSEESMEFYLEDDSKMQFTEGKAWVLVDEAFSDTNVTPSTGQNDVSTASAIEIEFNEKIKEGSLYKDIQLKNQLNQSIAITKTIEGNRLIIKPKEKLLNNQYYTFIMPEGAVENTKGMKSTEVKTEFKTKGEYDASLVLGKGWNLISTPKQVDEFSISEDDVDGWLSFGLKGETNTWLNEQEDVVKELQNPASAVFIKVNKETTIYFNWKTEVSPQESFATKTLTSGWNLIGVGTDSNLKDVLSDLRYENGKGLTRIYAPNLYNNNKQRPSNGWWLTNVLDLTEWNYNYSMNSYDGYWVYLKDTDEVYTTIVE